MIRLLYHFTKPAETVLPENALSSLGAQSETNRNIWRQIKSPGQLWPDLTVLIVKFALFRSYVQPRIPLKILEFEVITGKGFYGDRFAVIVFK